MLKRVNSRARVTALLLISLFFPSRCWRELLTEGGSVSEGANTALNVLPLGDKRAFSLEC